MKCDSLSLPKYINKSEKSINITFVKKNENIKELLLIKSKEIEELKTKNNSEKLLISSLKTKHKQNEVFIGSDRTTLI